MSKPIIHEVFSTKCVLQYALFLLLKSPIKTTFNATYVSIQFDGA